MQHSTEDNLITNHIYLASNGEYSRHLLKLCERCMENEKKVLLLTENSDVLLSLSDTMQKPRSLIHMERWMSIGAVKEMESAPRRIIELFDCLPRPQLIVFDLHSIVAAELLNTQLQILIRHMAKCAAAFCNYLQMLNMSKDVHLHAPTVIDAIVIMPISKYPLTPAHLKLLIGLYFSTSQLYTNFAAIVESIRQSQSLL